MAQRVPAIDKPVDGPHIAAEVGRLFVLLIVATLLQTTVAANIRILGANPDFVLVFVVAVALLRGAEIGATFGFFAGGIVSIALFEPPGVRSLALVAVGYLVGRYAETADLSPSVAPIVSVFVATLIAESLELLAQFLFGREVPVLYLIGRWVIPLLVLDTLLAVPLYVVARWWLRGERRVRISEA
ncbi:MAG: rod shape-determining protein MreD [Thermoleophilia bacterium]|jgi:rod shape-determining protein MreD